MAKTPAVPQDAVQFVSRYSNHHLTMVPTRVAVVNGETMVKPGRKIEFQGGVYTTADPDEIKFLRNHRMFKIDFHEVPQKKAAPVVDPDAGDKNTGNDQNPD